MVLSKYERILKCGCIRQVSLRVKPNAYRCSPGTISRTTRQYRNLNRPTPPPTQSVEDEVREYYAQYFSSLHPYHFRDRIQDLAKPTSPGEYYLRLGYKTKREVVEDPKALGRLRYYTHLIKSGKLRNAKPITRLCVANSKLTLNNGEATRKDRVVWVYPIEVCAIENMFYAPFNDRLPETWVPRPATHHDLFCGGFYNRSVDFSSFDASVHRDLIYTAFSILRSFLDFSEYEGGAKPYSHHGLSRLWGFIVQYFVRTPFRSEDGSVLRKEHGVPSGSLFTNLIDTIISRLVITFAHRYHNCPAVICTYGDDCHYTDCTNFDCADDTVESIAAMFGFKVKIELPNEHGCLTYCKAECHLGQPFHTGRWFKNILYTCPPSIRSVVAYCLTFMSPTDDQMKYLLQYARDEPENISSRLLMKVERLLEYLATEESPTCSSL